MRRINKRICSCIAMILLIIGTIQLPNNIISIKGATNPFTVAITDSSNTYGNTISLKYTIGASSGTYTLDKLKIVTTISEPEEKAYMVYNDSAALVLQRAPWYCSVAGSGFQFSRGDIQCSIIVSLSTETEAATIYYTTDGTNPSVEREMLYREPFLVNKTTTVKAIPVKNGMRNSLIKTYIYTILPTSTVEPSVEPSVEPTVLPEQVSYEFLEGKIQNIQ